MSEFNQTAKNRVKRLPNRAVYDKEVIYKIIDQAIICHVGFVQESQPFVIPTLHARIEDSVLIHGAATSRLMKHAAVGNELCITITLVDGLVLARSAFHHSINYRSVVLFGQGSIINEREEKLRALRIFTDYLMPGRWADVRPPTETEMKATTIVSMPIELASAKMRQGPPGDDAEDYQLDVWAGIVPIRQHVDQPIADPLLKDGVEIPENVQRYVLNQGR